MPDQSCVLIVEADILVRHPLAEYLRECGYRVLEARDAAEARPIIEALGASIDIILADAARPGLGGFELAAWARRLYPDIEMVLAGGVAKAVEKAGDICEEGPALSKPYEHHLVLDRIKRALAARERARHDR